MVNWVQVGVARQQSGVIVSRVGFADPLEGDLTSKTKMLQSAQLTMKGPVFKVWFTIFI